MDASHDKSMPNVQRTTPTDATSCGKAPEACLLRLVSVLVAGTLAWGVLQTTYPVLRMPEELRALNPPKGPPDKLREKAEFQRRMEIWNPIMALGMVGAVVCGSLAAGSCLAARCNLWIVPLAVLGIFTGAGFGCLAGCAGHLVASQIPKVHVPVSTDIELHVAVLTSMTAGIGLIIGLFGGRMRSALAGLLGGVAAGVFAGMAYPTPAVLLCPAAGMERIVPEVQVFAEGTSRHRLLQVPVGCGKDPHVDFSRSRLADRKDLVFLQHAEQFQHALRALGSQAGRA